MALDPKATVAVIVLAVVCNAGCADGQDPGVAPRDGPEQPSVTLGPCPPGGPDATTPPAGCRDPEGHVLRP